MSAAARPRRDAGQARADAAAARERALAEDPEGVAREVCTRLLAERARSRAELARAMARRGVPDEVAAGLLVRYAEVGLVDDDAFAAAWVESRHRSRGLSRRALAAELSERGVDSETAAAGLATVDDDAEREAARTLVRRRLAATRHLDPLARQRRAASLLARKGYPSGLALAVIREELARDGVDPGEDTGGGLG